MGVHAIRLPDVGEGVAEAELVELHVAVGDPVREDDIIAAVMTDKATVEIPCSVSGKILWIGGAVGDVLAVGSDLIRVQVDGAGNVDDGAEHAQTRQDPPSPDARAGHEAVESPGPEASVAEVPAPALTRPPLASPPSARPFPRSEGTRPLAAPSVRKRAREAGVDLRQVPGTGGAGQITHADLDTFIATGSSATAQMAGRPDTSVTEINMVGLRRRIARRMAAANAKVPHITIVEEVDVSALEELRTRLNDGQVDRSLKLTLIPFLMGAIVRAVRDQPALNAHFDDDAGVIRQFGGIHIGIATQTDGGLMVPVVRHCETLTLRQSAQELARVAQAARDGQADRTELTGSTITITSLGKLGAIATTPIINLPEVAIVGVNRIAVRPVWNGTEFTPRHVMNLSCSFDHRVIDGWDAAVFVQRLKTLLETPAMIFIES